MPEATELLLVRHGETEWNQASRVQGRLDSPLASTGIAQAKRTAAWLQFQPPVMGFRASPLGRARQTAAILAGALEVAPAWDERLAERCMGALQGLTLAEIQAQHPEFWAARDQDPWHTAPEGGESHADVAERVRPVLADCVAAGGRHLLVAHGIVNRVLVAMAMGLAPEDGARVRCPNDLVYCLQLGAGAPRVSHVRGGGAPVAGWFAG